MNDRDHLHALFRARARARENEAELHADFLKLCDSFDVVVTQRNVAHRALADCVTAINECMLEMSRNGDSIMVRTLADKARATAMGLIETAEV